MNAHQRRIAARARADSKAREDAICFEIDRALGDRLLPKRIVAPAFRIDAFYPMTIMPSRSLARMILI